MIIKGTAECPRCKREAETEYNTETAGFSFTCSCGLCYESKKEAA
jgi:hypothetical protein